MTLITVILILLAWGVIKIVEDIKYPMLPPSEDMEEELKKIQSLPNQKARQAYLRKQAREYRKNNHK